MAEVIIMPKLGFNMDEGELVRWHKQVGESVKAGEVLFEINTDKTTMPVEVTQDGTVLKIMLAEGEFADVFTPIAVVGQPGEDPDAALAAHTGGEVPAPAAEAASAAAPVVPEAPAAATPIAVVGQPGEDPDAALAAHTGGEVPAPAAEAASAAAPVVPEAPAAAAYEYEVTVIGGGPGGYVAAIRAAQAGKKTCIIEERYYGGTCLNVGCIPTKALIRTANLLQETKEAAGYGIEGIDPAQVKVNMAKLQERKQGVVKQLVNGVKGLLRGNKVTAVNGKASFVDAHTVAVGDKTITSENFIIATGSNVMIPGFIAQEGTNHLITSNEALELDHVPASIAIIGGGVIGVEFAYLLNKLGSKVTVLELMDHILPMVCPEVSEMARERMEKDGITFALTAKVQKVKDNVVYYELDGKECSVAADTVLMAVGRAPNTEGLNAEGIGLEFDRRAIKADDHLRTNLPHIYAIGDVNGKVMLAHTAEHEAAVAVANICGGDQTMNYDRIPSCIYLEPEIAAIGLTEQQAREKCANVKVGKFPMVANGKSLVEGDTDGMIKVILDADLDEILGVHMYGKHVTEMISELSVAMASELTAHEIIESIHPHPTVSESIPEAFMAAVNGRAIHSL